MGDIRIRNLKKEYINHRVLPRMKLNKGIIPGDTVKVLDNIDLDFEDGELVCLLGPSGCGKSTLLRIMAGFESYSGFISIDGKRIIGPSSDHIFVFQHNALLPWMTVGENVALGVRHLKKKERNSRTREYIEMVDLQGFEDHYPHHLSGGMLRRAELARALVVNPETLFMDEPFTGLDFLAHMKMREEVVNMHEFIGKTIILVTHDIDDALIMGDRVVILSGRPAHVKLDQKLDFSRPRDFRREPELNRLRNEIFLMLGVNYAV